jgi:hypothetical protein
MKYYARGLAAIERKWQEEWEDRNPQKERTPYERASGI